MRAALSVLRRFGLLVLTGAGTFCILLLALPVLALLFVLGLVTSIGFIGTLLGGAIFLFSHSAEAGHAALTAAGAGIVAFVAMMVLLDLAASAWQWLRRDRSTHDAPFIELAAR